ncbi:unnamed protein product [Anisakis simplex]|uniref:DnaJ homolog subfamily C member 17 (inferred by orthology to a human protein) n=1 Tax=Anisakis simplex TaxID=6269 RepID=A0A0M3JRE0_ANISI|nr:unnamed protein product [Anisakis simplex]
MANGNRVSGSLDFNPYEVLGVDEKSTDAEIVKAFRKAALKWHPDKNPDRKQQAEDMFLKISRALELLTDAAARAAYDGVCAARTARKIFVQRREQRETENRRRLREELERREAQAFSSQQDEKLAEAKLQKEVERLRKEGSDMLRRERENIERELRRKRDAFVAAKASSSAQCSSFTYNTFWICNIFIIYDILSFTVKGMDAEARLRLKWKRGRNNCDYDEKKLRNIFEKYGQISALVMSSSGKGSAIIEFADAKHGLDAENETGDLDNPLRISWISEKPDPETCISSLNFEEKSTSTSNVSSNLHNSDLNLAKSSSQFADFEAEILAKMTNTSGIAKKQTSADGSASKFDDI